MRGWNLLAGDLPLPLAALDRDALAHNLRWMQAYARDQGFDLAPHGKTTMSPELFERQLDAGAWGITFANVFQLRVGVAAGVRRALIANQLVQDIELAALRSLRAKHRDLRVVFLVDSLEQLQRIEAWSRAHGPAAPSKCCSRSGWRRAHRRAGALRDALALARPCRQRGRAAGRHRVLRGPWRHGDSARDSEYAAALMQRLADVAQACDDESLFESDEVIVSAGGSGIFDLVAARLRLNLRRPVRGLLRSGCYVTHDHGHYQRLVQQVKERCAAATA